MKTSWYQKKWIVATFHVAAWVLLFSLPYLLRPSYNPPPQHQKPSESSIMFFTILMNITWVGLFYLNAIALIPRFIYRRKYWLYTLVLLITFWFIIGETWLLYSLLVKSIYIFLAHVLISFFIFLFMIAASTAYQMIKDKMKADNLVQEKERETLKTELSLLRSQVSPHFMFNVLNNMVALARKKSDDLEPSLIRLSSLMRYMLYEADENRVPLDKEIEYLQSYIALQEQRFGKKVKVNVSFKNVDNHYEIEPMLLIPFVENAFKHGTGNIDEPEIDIELTGQHSLLQFQVRNKYNGHSNEIKDKTSGIGLANVVRRLNLLYGKNHSLLINKDGPWYTISLQLNLH